MKHYLNGYRTSDLGSYLWNFLGKKEFEKYKKILAHCQLSYIYLFGVLHHFQHPTGYITMDSFVGRGNQYIKLVELKLVSFST